MILLRMFFGGTSNVYWGVTGATGGLNNQQYFCPSTLVVLPIELTYYRFKCLDNQALIEWETSSETNLNYFQLEETKDGVNFTQVDVVNGKGGALQLTKYQLPVILNNESKYYRLKAVDNDGNFKTTGLISATSCTNQNHQLLKKHHFNSSTLNIDLSELFVQISLYDLTGKLIYENNSYDQLSTSCSLPNLDFAIYILKLQNLNHEIETYKLVPNQ